MAERDREGEREVYIDIYICICLHGERHMNILCIHEQRYRCREGVTVPYSEREEKMEKERVCTHVCKQKTLSIAIRSLYWPCVRSMTWNTFGYLAIWV